MSRPTIVPSLLAVAVAFGCAAESGGGGPGDTGTSNRDGGNDFRDECDNGLDDDRDGRVDEGCTCSAGETQRCFGGEPDTAGVGECLYGEQRCGNGEEFGTWDVCDGDGFPGDEQCDLVDNDCDGEVDEGCGCPPGATRPCYTGPAATMGVGVCADGEELCQASAGGTDWTACIGDITPGTEACDGDGDEDCDGKIDEGCTCTSGMSRPCWGGSAATRGVGTCSDGTQTCSGSAWGTCSGEVRPRTESCSGGMDEDCDGMVDCADPDCESTCCMGFSETLAVVPAEGEILFVVDRSGSMDWPAVGTTRTRWEELKTAMGSVLPMLDALPMGLLTFPQLTGDSEIGNCLVASTPDIGIASGTRSSILSRLNTVDPRAGDTPTPDAFDTASSYFASTSSSAIRFVILATDGLPEPNCGATVPATVTAISSLRSSRGIDTFVLGIVGPDPSGDTSGIPALQAGLNDMADAGGRARSGAIRYYEAVDGATLTSSLEAIVAAATDCRFSLGSAPPRPADVEVRQDGTLVPPSGYTLSGTSLEFTGTYCDQIQAGLVSSITVVDSCS